MSDVPQETLFYPWSCKDHHYEQKSKDTLFLAWLWYRSSTRNFNKKIHPNYFPFISDIRQASCILYAIILNQ